MKRGAVLVGLLQHAAAAGGRKALRQQGISAFDMELVPRITPTQSMDVLSSQSNLGATRRCSMPAARVRPCLPEMMTAPAHPAGRVLRHGRRARRRAEGDRPAGVSAP